MRNPKILVIGSNGQLGTALVPALQQKYGSKNVIAADIFRKENGFENYELLDAGNFEQLRQTVATKGIDHIYHLAAILSAKGEREPLKTWDINMKTLQNVLEVARLEQVRKVFYPSSIAVFGPSLPQKIGQQNSTLQPTTVYGISKSAGEDWCNYYHKTYSLDVRSLRYPGVIGYQSLPGGGTTDYAVDIFHKAVKEETFECFLAADTRLPMIFMDDAIRATIELMSAPAKNIRIRSSYNLAGLSFSPAELTNEIKKFIPNFEIKYAPDFRQKIADSWPAFIDDRATRADWGWAPAFDLHKICETMITQLKLQNEPAHV